MSDMREEFDAWYSPRYDTGSVDFWECWQAACANKDSEFAKEREQLRAEIAELDAALNDDWGTDVQQSNLRAKKRLSEANAFIVMQAEALRNSMHCITVCETEEFAPMMREQNEHNDKALSASAESVAAWEAEKLEPLQRKINAARDAIKEKDEAYAALDRLLLESINETKAANAELDPLRRDVAMLRDALINHQKLTRPIQQSIDALTDTQATAKAYERELKAKALEEFAFKVKDANAGELSRFVELNDCLTMVYNEAAELRAQSAQKKGGE